MAGIGVRAGVPLPLVKVPTSLFLLADKGLRRRLQQVCRPAMLIAYVNFKDK